MTAISYPRGDCLEYEVIKDSASYGIQLLVDSDDRTVQSVSVFDNLSSQPSAGESSCTQTPS